MKNNQDKPPDSFFEVFGVLALCVTVLLGMMWFVASHRVVYFMTPFIRWVGVGWAVLDHSTWAAINEAYVFYREKPKQVGLGNFLAFINTCFQPLAILSAVGMAVLAALRFRVKTAESLRRRLKPEQLMRQISGTFTNIIPTMHLGEKLLKDKLPKWRRQTFPSDVWTHGKVRGLPISKGEHIFQERVEEYFYGGPLDQMRNGLRWSNMLGFQVAHLARDANIQDKSVLCDRFSSEGKILLGLLAAHAFGGREGKLDYAKAKDQLNRSCAGHSDGMPNLSVGQWIFDKYKNHADVKGLFAVHHWEYSYLYALFGIAKKNGKATHTEWIWLKPTNRILFYVLNTYGRSTPPIEAATAFSQYDYERKVSKKGWLPFVTDEAKKVLIAADGFPIHRIMIFNPVKNFMDEFEKYKTKTSDDDNWWGAATKNFTDAHALTEMTRALSLGSHAIHAATASGPAPDTEFDVAMNRLREKELARQQAEAEAAAAANQSET